MKFVLDPHIHTLASGHAYSTIMDYIYEARELGMELIAVTDHAPAMPCSVGEVYFTNFRAVPKTIDGVTLMLGAELNILDGSGAIDLSERTMSQISPLIASLHPLCYKFKAENMAFDEILSEITNAIFSVMDNSYVHILGHPGDPRYPFDIDAVVQKSIETGTLIEINNASLKESSFRRGSRDIMLELLRACGKSGCPIVLSSDAHFSKDAGRFEEAFELLEETRFPTELVANTSVDKFYQLLEAASFVNVF